MPFDLGWPEIVLVLLIVLIIFGAGKLPQIGSALGKSIKDFQKARDGKYREIELSDRDIAKSSEAKTEVKS